MPLWKPKNWFWAKDILLFRVKYDLSSDTRLILVKTGLHFKAKKWLLNKCSYMLNDLLLDLVDYHRLWIINW